MAGDRLINVYKEINDGQHPAIGTRVEKGSDWTWGNQNRDKDGTIIGHADDPNGNSINIKSKLQGVNKSSALIHFRFAHLRSVANVDRIEKV
jgi:hypothetical protein